MRNDMNYCIDCGKKVTKKSRRCRHCTMINRWKEPSYKEFIIKCRSAWTNEEKLLLKEKYSDINVSHNELMEIFPSKTKSAIFQKAHELGARRINPSTLPRNLPEMELRNLYSEKSLSLEAVGKIFGCTAKTIQAYLIKFGIPRRPSYGYFKFEVPFEEIKKWSDVDKAYLAGIIDGEGHISITNNSTIQISITNTSTELMKKMSTMMRGGSIKKSNRLTANRKEVFVFYINTTAKSYVVLTQILPYMIIKKEVAVKAIKVAKESLQSYNKIAFQKINENMNIKIND